MTYETAGGESGISITAMFSTCKRLLDTVSTLKLYLFEADKLIMNPKLFEAKLTLDK